ncbi:MAG: methylenetetrahydrofolate reductase [NAD(P)H] [Candidatus Lambdaproteobacteria bacterium RIFOXYD1_FULL_56_27]|uniref:Methylenetetrahydrofolate reductase n=1 Tax=Candidatus Lambdaproteobacteria bacterium RIFOXYD2_FULL_56_26 TaxID=1817773 RepID=A0A1F6GSG3_9PROT|nr:MAG: methylenetetrahydrofolate reductase [NAD(P)H] [Candidatus Lambdaproteobacteria bacterium RIFOXYD2_FULL_56_26]OGH01333.1 MAG: methylenetetrahydrofolate reductase [NAD(P)H] [Candidatus Lambdaproteobacteria bacterium RIFOXYC1_FULL_56_13]OGH06873.1 MAG: methylenetetrahydrofolate reductase [NAD(P)H] [Candidatus Lambdaproteobacteria bacterium RIFOXYD1_FULL_56_27]
MPNARKIQNLYAYNTHVSFEVFPPKTNQGLKQIYQTIARLKGMSPDFFSVTYGAGGSTAEKSLDIASAITNLAQVTCVAHFTCAHLSRPQVLELLQSLEFHGINNVLALRGDPPQGQGTFVRPQDGFGYASELVAFIREHSKVGILVAGYPEGHMENPDKEDDFRHLVQKVEAGADGIVTQLFFDNRFLVEFKEKLDRAGVQVPLVAGIFPLSNLKQLDRIASMSKNYVPPRLKAGLEKWANDPESMEQFGTDYAIEQVQGLLDLGFRDFHFYTMNRYQQTRNILFALKDYFPRLKFD